MTLDTSGLVAVMDRHDPNHGRAARALADDRGPYVIPTAILAEIAYFLEQKVGGRVLDALLEDLEAGRYRLDCGEEDLSRIRHLVQRYADLPLGFADAAVIACAERHGGKVLTLDFRHFGVVAREGTITILP